MAKQAPDLSGLVIVVNGESELGPPATVLLRFFRAADGAYATLRGEHRVVFLDGDAVVLLELPAASVVVGSVWVVAVPVPSADRLARLAVGPEDRPVLSVFGLAELGAVLDFTALGAALDGSSAGL
jgi:hypothetical protein